MSTEAQILANRRNAQASTGPRTPQGKSVSSANSTKHGLAAGFRVLANENQQEFDGLIADYHTEFAPATNYERFLIEEMAQSRWRLARIRRLEAAVIERIVGPGDPPDADTVLASALVDNLTGPPAPPATLRRSRRAIRLSSPETTPRPPQNRPLGQFGDGHRIPAPGSP